MAAPLLFVAPELPVAWLALNLLLLDLLIHLGTAIHEACHALSGRALGLKVFRIVLGCGRTQWKGPLFGTLVEWKAIPLGGMTLVAPVSPSAVRSRMAVTTLAGLWVLNIGPPRNCRAFLLPACGSREPDSQGIAPACRRASPTVA